MVNGIRAVGAIGVVAALFGGAACSGSTSGTKPLAKGATTTSTRRVSGHTTSSAAPPAACTVALTSDPYDGFHIGVPNGWNLFTLDGTIVVSKDATGTEQVAVLPALMTTGLTPSSFFTASLGVLQKQVALSGGTLSWKIASDRAVLPSAQLTLRAGQVTMSGTASVKVLPQTTAHSSSQIAFIADWAPVAQFATERATLAGIGACYGPQAATLFRVAKDQVFTYAIPAGWTTRNEGQDNIEIADGNDAYVSYTLAATAPGSGVDSAQSFLSWAFGRLGIKVTQVIGSAGSKDQLYEQFLATLSDGRSAHGLVNIVSSTGSGLPSGVIRLALASPARWNSVNGALIQIMSSIQHDFKQDLQQWHRIQQQWQTISRQWQDISQQGNTFNQNFQGFDDALNGVDLVHDPTTGDTFEAPYNAYSATGPDGPGYYSHAGNRLEIQTP
jgi:hypothetical protein